MFTIKKKEEIAPKFWRFRRRRPRDRPQAPRGPVRHPPPRRGRRAHPAHHRRLGRARRARSPWSSRRSARRRCSSASLEEGGAAPDVVGPLGKPTHIEKLAARWSASAAASASRRCYPIAAAMKEAGNHVISILGGAQQGPDHPARTRCGARRDELIVCHRRRLATAARASSPTRSRRCIEGGGEGRPGRRDRPGDHDEVRRQTTAAATGSRPVVSLNPIMVDGTGMCGGCRVDGRRQDEVRLRRRPGVRRPPGRLRRADARASAATYRRGEGSRARQCLRDHDCRGCERRHGDDEPNQSDSPTTPKTETATKADAQRQHDARAGRRRSASHNFERGRRSATPRSRRSSRPPLHRSARSPTASRAARSASTSRPSSQLIATRRLRRARSRRSRRPTSCPAICGRVCPQENQCEALCVLGQEGRAGRDRPARALRRRLGARARASRRMPRRAAADRQEGRRRRLRPGRPRPAPATWPRPATT